MAKNVVLGNFSTILTRTRDVLARGKRVPDPFRGAYNLTVFKDVVADGRRLLPSRYQQRYVDVLDNVVRQAEGLLDSLDPLDVRSRRIVFEQLQAVFSIVAAPIVQLRSTQHQRELKAFLAEISNIYRRFVNDDQVQKGAKFTMLSPDLDPLGSFGHDAAGPFTMPAGRDLPVAIVSKPANQMDFLPLWAADGHEVGGHDIYGAVAGYQSDLQKALEANLRAAFRSGCVKTAANTVSMPVRGGLLAWLLGSRKQLPMEDFMVHVWSAWLNEASSDHAGLVNIGPMYLDSLMLLLAAVRPHGKLSTFSVYDRQVFAGTHGFEEHPIDVVRVLLNIEAIKHLHFSDGKAYASALAGRLTSLLGGRLPASVVWLDRKGAVVTQIALSDFQAVVPVVVETIMDAKLAALANQSFGEIINWLDSDETEVETLAKKLAAGDAEYDENAEARHVVAASMLALERAAVTLAGAEFASAARLIHDTGITMLHQMYEDQCLLCSISGPIHAVTPDVDWTRLLNHVKSRWMSSRSCFRS